MEGSRSSRWDSSHIPSPDPAPRARPQDGPPPHVNALPTVALGTRLEHLLQGCGSPGTPETPAVGPGQAAVPSVHPQGCRPPQRTEGPQGSPSLGPETPVPTPSPGAGPLLESCGGPSRTVSPFLPSPHEPQQQGRWGSSAPAADTPGSPLWAQTVQPVLTTPRSASRLELGECGPLCEGDRGVDRSWGRGRLKGAGPAPGPPDPPPPRPEPGHSPTSTAQPAGVREEAEPLLQLQGFQGLLRHPFLQGGAPRARVCGRAGCR